MIPVIILNYNSFSDCKKCTSFLQQQTDISLEIIIVDNCSREDDRKAVQELCRTNKYTFIPNEENRGYNAGNNIGLRHARDKGYRYALIANPDMEFPESEYVATLANKMDQDDTIAVLGSNIIDADGQHQNPIRFIYFWEEFFWPIEMLRSKLSKKSLNNVLASRPSRYCPVVSGCCFMIRIDFLESINFFDENIFLYCEEGILATQVERAGKRLYYLSEKTAIHKHIKSEKGNPIKRLLILCQSRNYKNKYYSDYNKIQIYLLALSQKTKIWILSLIDPQL